MEKNSIVDHSFGTTDRSRCRSVPTTQRHLKCLTIEIYVLICYFITNMTYWNVLKYMCILYSFRYGILYNFIMTPLEFCFPFLGVTRFTLRRLNDFPTVSLFGLSAKIKCSICSYQLNIWYTLHRRIQMLN